MILKRMVILESENGISRFPDLGSVRGGPNRKTCREAWAHIALESTSYAHLLCGFFLKSTATPSGASAQWQQNFSTIFFLLFQTFALPKRTMFLNTFQGREIRVPLPAPPPKKNCGGKTNDFAYFPGKSYYGPYWKNALQPVPVRRFNVPSCPLCPMPTPPPQERKLYGCGFFAYSWKLPTYNGAFLLTVDNFSYFTYSWSLSAYSFSFFTYTGTFLLTVGKCV